MTQNSKIEWTDHTINFWWGCQKVSPGCEHCYAESMAKRVGNDIWGRDKPRRWIKAAVSDALKLNEKAKKAGVRFKVFTNSMADFFEEDHGQAIVSHRRDTDGTPFRLYHFEGGFREHRLSAIICGEPVTLTDLRRQAFETIDRTPHLDWLLLTKRPENIESMWPDAGYDALRERRNVWLGCTVENQEQADKRIPELLKCRELSPVLFLSCEPLLGAVDLCRCKAVGKPASAGCKPFHGILCPLWSLDWVIVGGESGHNARPMHPDWARSLRDQCEAARVPYFFKQWGEYVPEHHPAAVPNQTRIDDSFVLYVDEAGNEVPSQAYADDYEGEYMFRVGKKAAGRLLDGREWSELPEVTHA